MTFQIRHEAEELASFVRSEYGLPTDGPVPVEELAKKMGISISHQNLLRDIEATSNTKGGSPEIIIEPDMHELRARFTIAHEIAHLLVDSSVENNLTNINISASSSGEMEYFCHEFAAKLLLPDEAIRPVSDWEKFTIRRVAKLGRELGVAVEPTLRRVLEVARGDGGLLLFDRIDGVNDERPFKLQRGVFPSSNIRSSKNNKMVIPYRSSLFRPLLNAYEDGTEHLIKDMAFNLKPFPRKSNIKTAVRAKSYRKSLLLILIPPEVGWENLCKNDSIVVM